MKEREKLRRIDGRGNDNLDTLRGRREPAEPRHRSPNKSSRVEELGLKDKLDEVGVVTELEGSRKGLQYCAISGEMEYS